MTPPQLQLPTIKVSDIEILTDWDFENVKALGDSIPGFRSSSSKQSTCLLLSPTLSLSSHAHDPGIWITSLTRTSFPDNPPL